MEGLEARLLLSYNSNSGSYIGKVMLGSIPKMLIILLCIVIAAFTTEITFGATDVDGAGCGICYLNPKAETSDSRICFSLVATAISCIMVCMMLMIFDVLIPCVDIMFRRMAHGLSLFLSIIMGIMLLVTSSLMVNIYVKYCDYLEDLHDEYPGFATCGDDQRPFLVLPLLGYFTIIIWGFNGLISLMRLAQNHQVTEKL